MPWEPAYAAAAPSARGGGLGLGVPRHPGDDAATASARQLAPVPDSPNPARPAAQMRETALDLSPVRVGRRCA
ncbi:MAG: hypothetical protein LBT54_04760 [Bifidobacteriaceae bacterium]|jgi:hypothetical protein|nr:hypothetical protein [Bifidobacteriaceae bacterium]